MKTINTALVSNTLELGYIKNKDGKVTNPTLYLFANIDLSTNMVSNVRFHVNSFENKSTYGYCREIYHTYQEAKEVYDKLFNYHIG